MKKALYLLMLSAIAAVMLISCKKDNENPEDYYVKMAKDSDQIQVSCNPQVLIRQGSSVTADIAVSFPPKYFNESAVLRITPVLVFDGGEIAGTPKFVQGEKVENNFTVISWEKGGYYTQSVTFPYDKRANTSTLVLRFEIRYNSDYLPLNSVRRDVVVASGINNDPA